MLLFEQEFECTSEGAAYFYEQFSNPISMTKFHGVLHNAMSLLWGCFMRLPLNEIKTFPPFIQLTPHQTPPFLLFHIPDCAYVNAECVFGYSSDSLCFGWSKILNRCYFFQCMHSSDFQLLEVWCDNCYTFSPIINPKILLSFSLNILQDETGMVKKTDVFCLCIFALKR